MRLFTTGGAAGQWHIRANRTGSQILAAGAITTFVREFRGKADNRCCKTFDVDQKTAMFGRCAYSYALQVE
jgi:hypothetical protein